MTYIWEVHGDIETTDGFTTKVKNAVLWIQENGRQTPGTVVQTSDNASDYLNFSVRFSGQKKGLLRDLLVFAGNKTYRVDIDSAVRTNAISQGP